MHQQHGFILLPVVLLITVVATVAFLINHDSALNVDMTNSGTETVRIEQITRAGLVHATWATQASACGGDFTLPAHIIDDGTYSATVASPGGSTTAYALIVDQDAWFRSDDITNNNGSTDVKYHLRMESGNLEYAVVRFDLSALPTGAKINSAVARFYVIGGKGHPEGPVTVHRVVADWTEADATWDTMGTNFDSVILSTISAQPVVGGNWVTVNLTAQVQAWVNGGESNHGIMLIPTGEGIKARYTSREGVASQQPRLDVVVGTGDASPATINVTGTLTGVPSPANDVTRTLTLTNASVYQPGSYTRLQPGAVSGEDAEIWQQSPDNNYGNAAETWVSSAGNDTTRSLLRFNMGAIPVGAKILQANLSLQRQSGSGSGGPVSAHRVRNPWSEASVTWNERKNGSNWDTAGSDFDSKALATTLVGPANQRYEWSITSLVQDWVDGSAPNYGVVLVGAIAGMSGERFYTSDASDPAWHPHLSITYICECGVSCAVPQGTGKIALIGDYIGLSPDPRDSAKKEIFESWGYDVDIYDHSLFLFDQNNYDVVYVSETVLSTTIGTNLTNISIGLVNEEPNLLDELQIANSEAEGVGSAITITDNSHYITAPFASGTLPIYDVDMEVVTANPGLAPGLQVLAEFNGSVTLATLDKGAQLLDGSNAAGRRVTLPLGQYSNANFNWDYLNANGHLLVQRAIQWGTGNTGPVTSDPIILSTDSAATLGGLNFDDIDLAEYDPVTSTATLYFDGSTTTLTPDIDAIHVLANGHILMSTKDDTTFGGLNFQDGSLVDYDPTTDVATLYFNETAFGSDEDIVSVYVMANGHLLLSTDSDANLGGLNFTDNDLIEYDLDTDTATLYFDGSTTTLISDIDAVHVLDNGHLLLSTKDDASLGGLNFKNGDLIEYDQATDTATLYFDEGKFSANENVISTHIGAGSGVLTGGGGGGGATAPVAHWKLDDASGITAIDSEGGHDGTLTNGPNWGTGQLDGALDFDGSNDYINVPHSADLSLTNVMSFTAWVNASSYGPRYKTIISKDDGGSGSNYYFGTWRRELEFGFWSGGFFRSVFTNGLNLQTDTWYHLAATFDDTANEVLLYVNGIQVHSGSLTFSPTVVSADLTIGNSPDGEYWDGLLDDVRLYNSVLPTSEIADLYAAGSGGGGGSGSSGYVERSQQWSATSDDTWQTVDLSSYGVPADAVVEVAITNSKTGNERWGGVRAVGSSLDRRFLLHEPEGGGLDAVTIHVQVDNNGLIQHYSDNKADVTFTLLGYWTDATYVERFDVFAAGGSNSWRDHNLAAYGVGADQVAEIVISNKSASSEYRGGVRTNGSSAQRRIQIHEAESGGVDTVTRLSVADSTSNATVEVYTESNSNMDFTLVGYWSVPPGTFTEKSGQTGKPSSTSSWENKDLSSYGIPVNAVAHVILRNLAPSNERMMGVRATGSSLARTIDLHEAESGGADMVGLHVTVDSSGNIQWFSEAINNQIIVFGGYWELN